MGLGASLVLLGLGLMVPRQLDEGVWSRQAWTDINPIYARRRAELEAMSANELRSAVENAENWVQQKPGWQAAMFTTAYGVWLGRRRQLEWANEPIRQLTNHLLEVANKIPASYEFHRALYLATRLGLPRPWQYALGERLVKRNPLDDDVVYAHISVALDSARGDPDYGRAIKWCDNLVARHPKTGAMYALRADAHLRRFYVKKRKADLDAAEQGYKDCDRLLPKGDPFRKYIPDLLDEISGLRKKFGIK